VKRKGTVSGITGERLVICWRRTTETPCIVLPQNVAFGSSEAKAFERNV